jgi:aldehyde dehydrogenase (NAD+)
MSRQPELWQGQYDRLFIGGRWVEPATDRKVQVVSPSTEELVATVPEAVEADVDAAVEAARRAFDQGPWPGMGLKERMDVLRHVSAGLAEKVSEIAHLVTSEMGSPISLSTSYQATAPRLMLDSFIDLAPAYSWQDVRRSATGNALVTREPSGSCSRDYPLERSAAYLDHQGRARTDRRLHSDSEADAGDVA